MNTKQILSAVANPYHKQGIPAFRPGDTVRVYVKVVEGESERIQPFEGIVIKKRGGGLSETFTVRKTSFGVGIERTFPIHSPRIDKIELIKSGKVRRAKLYYLRELSGKAARLADKEKTSEDTTGESKASPQPDAAQAPSSPEPAVTH